MMRPKHYFIPIQRCWALHYRNRIKQRPLAKAQLLYVPESCASFQQNESVLTALDQRRALSMTVLSAPVQSSPSHYTADTDSSIHHHRTEEWIVNQIVQPIRKEVRDYTHQLHSEDLMEPPHLVGILANEDPSAVNYSHEIERMCLEDGIRYTLQHTVDLGRIKTMIQSANEDPSVTGVLVYYPIFATSGRRGPYKNQLQGVYYKTHDDFLQDTVSRQCDVEGLCHHYNARLIHKDPDYVVDGWNDENFKYIFPCTAMSVVKVLQACSDLYNPRLDIGQRFTDNVITIINRSEILGRPLAAMLNNDGAKVYSVDKRSILLFDHGRVNRCDREMKIESCVRQSNVLITGVPDPTFVVPTEWIQPYSTVVNVAHVRNIEEESIVHVEGVRYVPAVGKVTVAILERNLVSLHKRYHSNRRIQESSCVA